MAETTSTVFRIHSDSVPRLGERRSIDLGAGSGVAFPVIAEVVWYGRLPAGAASRFEIGVVVVAPEAPRTPEAARALVQ